ncbi:MAG: amidase [Alphaproteobacteria bacterium CG_4_9_14_3_um_filter_47_13]|nr:MAG: amidase [Alphaproteobacteria bacterium CG_4_9_14_3_um_filter_47_13]
MIHQYLSQPVSKILEQYKKGTLSPVDVVKASCDQIEKYQPLLNPFIVIAEKDELLKQAEESEIRWSKGEPEGMIDGIPVTIKDDCDIAGWPMREGSLTTSEKPALVDGPQPQRLREAGAIFLGKTNMPEFGHKSATDSKLNGTTRNPWNPEYTTGGSSGGEAIAAATGMGYFHLGSDGGGSIRIPACYCGTYGIKPTTGLVPEMPPGPFSGIATSGPLTRYVEDAAMMLDIISRPDLRDWFTVPYEERNFYKNLNNTPKGLRIAYARTVNNAPVDSDVARHVDSAVKKMQSMGTVEEITLDIPDLVENWNAHWMTIANWIEHKMEDSKRPLLERYFREWALRGTKMDLYDLVDAQLARAKIGIYMNMLLDKYDILVLPTMDTTAYTVEQGINAGIDGKLQAYNNHIPFTFIANLSKQPAASVPCGLGDNGLPVGIQIMAGLLKDGLVLNVSHVLQQELGFQDWMISQMQKQDTVRKSA